MPVDIKELWTGGGLSDPDKEVRDAAVDGAKTWIDIALAVGSKSVRCDPGKMNPEDLSPTVESYKRLAAYGRPKGVHVIIENHGGVGSEHPEELVRLFKQAGEMGKASAIRPADWLPWRKRSSTARRVGSASALKAAPGESVTKR